MIYYEKRNDIPPVPEDLKNELIKIAEQSVANGDQPSLWHGSYGSQDKNSISYLDPEELFIEKTGGVGFYLSPPELSSELVKLYKKFPGLETYNYYTIQIVTGSTFVAPHVDDPNHRGSGVQCLLKSGGSNVRTKWYQIKDEHKHLKIETNRAIPYSKLIEVDDHCLEENAWHWLNFSQIHSVENQESLRVGLWGVQWPTD